MTIAPKSLRRPDWLQIWAGGWSILSCSHFAEEYVQLIKFHGRPFLPESIIIIRHGKSEGWARLKDREAICAYLAREVVKDTSRAKAICQDLKKQSRAIRSFMAKHKNGVINKEIYVSFWDKLVRYYQPHINVKYVVDGLLPERLKQLLPYFEEARLFAEDVLNQTEKWLEVVAKIIGAKNKLPGRLVLCCTRHEMMKYFQSGKFPGRAELKERDKLFGIYSDLHREAEYVGQPAQTLVRVVTEIQQKDLLHGTAAYPGIVSGVVRVVHDPRKARIFNAGDILVSGMTRPEFMPLLKKAAAFVTDSGGILSHAAIVAREMKKSCIIGTKVATKVLKDGDRVKVDANNGVVRKI